MGQPQLEAFTPHAELVSADALGIELELEGFTGESMDQASRLVRPLWTIIGDGSLRNGGAEFITQGGFGGTKLIQAIDKLQVALERVNYDASWRCSTHMHINMLDFTVNQVVRFILVYAACEPVLFEFCGAYRKSSNFCTPLGDSLPFHRKIISRMYDDAVSRRSPQQHANKYVALNILPLFPDNRGRALGTVEFRGGRPLVDRAEMLTQANLLLSIKQYVRDFEGDEEALLNSMAEGVHSSVFSNGVAAGISPSVDSLELSLVHSWALLKSYQQGKAAQAERIAELTAQGIDPNDMEGEGGVPVAAAPTGSPLFGRTERTAAFRGSHIPAMPGGMQIDDLNTLRLIASEHRWPSLFSNFGSLTAGSPRSMMNSAFAAGLSRSHPAHGTMTTHNVMVGLLNWAGNLHPESTELTPIPTLIRMRTRHNYDPLYSEPVANLPAQPDTRYKMVRILYQQTLGAERWAELLGRIGYDSTARNVDVWNWLANHQVRTKGRTTLQTRLNDMTEGRRCNLNLEVAAPVSTVRLHAVLRMGGLPSRAHVWTSDRVAYDNFVYVINLLNEFDLDVPFIANGVMSFAHGLNCHAGLADCIAHPYINATYANRTPDRTISGDTLRSVSIY